MKCEKCNVNEAKVFITATDKNGTKKYRLCPDCAKEIKLEIPQMHMSTSIFGDDIFDEDIFNKSLFGVMSPMMRMLGLANPLIETDYSKGNGSIDRSYGNECESTEDKIEKNSAKIKEFSEQIEVLKKENSELNKRLKEENSSEFKIKQLKKELKNAIENEYFERAAQIRDEIKKLEK